MPSSADDAQDAFGFWGCRAVRPDGSTATYTLVQSSQHADRQRVTMPIGRARAEVGERAACVAEFGRSDHIRALMVTPLMAPKAPPMWFTEVPEPDAVPPALSLVSFTGHGIEPGTLVDRDALRDLSVKSSDQLGAMRIYPRTGEVHQLYVSPRFRGQHIASVLLLAVSTLVAARDWPDTWADGQRTADGERLFQARAHWRKEWAVQTHLLAPMTPFEER